MPSHRSKTSRRLREATHPSLRCWVRWGVLVGWLGCGLVPALVQAEPAADPCLSDAQCQDLISRARTLSKAQKYEPALAAYRAAQALHPVVWLLVNIGRMEHKLGRHADAIAHYREYLARTESDGDSELRQKARQYLQETEVEQSLATSSPPSSQVVPQSPDPRSPAAPREPITKKWWFWTAVGGGVAVIAGVSIGVGLAVYASPPSLVGAPVFMPFGP